MQPLKTSFNQKYKNNDEKKKKKKILKINSN